MPEDLMFPLDGARSFEFLIGSCRRAEKGHAERSEASILKVE
jgi:hypothetical protein